MKVFKVISFFAATLILLLHSFVPHEHDEYGYSSITNHTVPSNVIDQIALGFHISQTDGQLEHFMFDDDATENDSQLVAVISVVVFGVNTSDLQTYDIICYEQNTSFKSLNVAGFSHRGPPIS